MIGTHFDYRKAVLCSNAQQHQRQANVVIEIAGGCKRRRGLGKTSGDHFLQRRLAITAGHTDNCCSMLLPPGGAESAQRDARIVNSDLCNVVVDSTRYYGASRTFRSSVCDEWEAGMYDGLLFCCRGTGS